MRKIMIFLSFTIFLFGWELKGIRGDVAIADLNLSRSIIWAYQDGNWTTTDENSKYSKLTNLKGGEGYWIDTDMNIQTGPYINDGYEWQEGWNLVSPVFEKWNMRERFKDKVPFAWKYENGEWKLFLLNGINWYRSFNYVDLNEGVWVYLPKIDIKMNNQPIFCKDGNCSKVNTTDTSYKIYIKIDKYNSDLKFAFDLYRYSNNTHYKLAFGPFQIDSNGVLTENISVCVKKEGKGGSCKSVDNSKDTFLRYEQGYLTVDSQKIAQIFGKTIPSTKEKFKMKIYIEGFDVEGFTADNDFGTLGIEGFGTWVKLTNNKSIEFEMEIK